MKNNQKVTFWKEFIPKSFTYLNKKNYSWGFFKSDLIAGVTVGVVALPLAMAFAIAAGLPPEKGLVTGIIAGFLISFLGGSRYQVGGPTGAFVVIIYAIVQKNGFEGMILVTIIAGIILLIAAFARIGTLIKYIPYPLIIGFTTGIAVIIFSSQVKDFLGLKIVNMPADFISIWTNIFSVLPTIDFITFAVALGTLFLILLIRRFYPILPWGITSVVVMTIVVWVFNFPIETIQTRFGEMKLTFSLPNFKNFSISISDWRSLIPDAITIALLAGIESLLSALVADGMTGGKHRSNCELMAQGVANIGSVLLGGIPATGAIARTATIIKTGAKSPLAGMIHSLTLLIIVLFFAPLVSKIPLASLSAVLIMVAWNMSEYQHFRHLFKAPFSDIVVLLSTFLCTVFIDLTVAIEIGMILSVFLFVKRMKETSGLTSLTVLDKEYKEESEKYDVDSIEKKTLPARVEVFEISGPFFFGVADCLKNALSNIELTPKIFILRMRKVPMIDTSGMHALIDFYNVCKKEGTTLFLSGVGLQLSKSLKKYGVIDLIGEKNIFSHIDYALKKAAEIMDNK
ncbi:MAG: sulfate permease [Parachlamydiales bacterium]|nr:sulfate permease [Parachlamydiales bacterium]